MPDYSEIDRSSILTYVFYPRDTFSTCPRWGFDHFVPVAEDISLHCRFYKENDNWPWVLHFHGNGEVVSDYDEIAIFYLKYGINLVVADYRGYGKSTGDPTLTDISHDAHIVYDSVTKELVKRGFPVRPLDYGTFPWKHPGAGDCPSSERRNPGAYHRKRLSEHHPPPCAPGCPANRNRS